MNCSKKNLLDRIQQGASVEYLFFWEHQLSPNGKVTASCLSQWWPCEFTDGDLRYCCAEQFMMAAKAHCFHDEFTQHRILAENDPAAIKKLGRQVRNFSPVLWDEKKCAIVIEGNILKFLQKPALRDFLLQSGIWYWWKPVPVTASGASACEETIRTAGSRKNGAAKIFSDSR